MSLKIIHCVFIFFSILLSAGFGIWAIRIACPEISQGYCLAGAFALGTAAGLGVYGWYFLKKMKTL